MSSRSGTPSQAERPSKAASRGSAAFERDYLEMMIDHHHMATKMAEAAQSGGVRSELRERATKMRADQMREIDQLREWLRAWHDKDKKPQLSARDRSMVEKLEGMGDHELEMEFLSMMVDHHETAIRKAKDAAGKVQHEELASFSREMVEKQSRERDEMQRWLREWHARA